MAQQGDDSGLARAGSYFGSIGGMMVSGGPVGLVLVFVSAVIQGITQVIKKRKEHNAFMAWQNDAIEAMFTSNLEQEETIQAEIRNEMDDQKAAAEGSIKDTLIQQIVFALILIIIVLVVAFYAFQAKNKSA